LASTGWAKGTGYSVNAFFMEKPGSKRSKLIAKIVAYYELLNWLKSLGIELS